MSVHINIYCDVCLLVGLFEETRISTSLNHASIYAWYIRHLLVDKMVFKICGPHCNVPWANQRLCVGPTVGRVTFVYISTCGTSGSVWYRQLVVSLSCTFQRAVLAALCGTDGGYCHFHCTVLAALSGTGVCLCLLFFINRCLFTDLCQTSVGRRYEKTNVRW